MTDNTFRNFFDIKTTEDKFYEKIDFGHFQKLQEMAMWGDVAKLPVNIDEDDIEFLSQFPQKFWANALKKRYDMLFDALEKNHEERKTKMKPIQDAIENALETGDWDGLKGMIPDEKISNMMNRYQRMSRKIDPKEEAEREAWEIVKPSTDRVESPGEVDFTFRQKDYDHENEVEIGSNKKLHTFVANPLLNRLYHKLERTKKLPHLPDSGLAGKIGKYGYNMHNPIRGPKIFHVKLKNGDEIEIIARDEKDVPDAVQAKGYQKTDILKNGIKLNSQLSNQTAGMKFPGEMTIDSRMSDFLNYNSHRAFGDLPENVKWLKAGQLDRSVIKHLEDKIQRKIEDELRRSGKYADEKQVRQAASKLVKERMIEMANAGKLKGPPIPGRFPEGLPVTVENGKLVPPPLYLPYQMKDVKVKDEKGGVVTQKRAIPIVNPAHFFRSLGSDEKDFTYDDNGKIKYDPTTGEPIWNQDLVNSGKLRGHDKKLVHVDDDEYKQNVHRAPGAYQFNHDSGGREYLSPGTEGYEDAYRKVFGDEGMGLEMAELTGFGKMTRIKRSDSGNFFKDILDGLKPCWTAGNCGNATSHEGSIIAANIDALHQMVAQKMAMTLRSEKLWGNTEEAKKARRMFSNNVGGSYAQKDLGEGGGTRRLRKYSQQQQSLDGTSQGKESEFKTQDATLANAVDKPIFLANRGKGNRNLISNSEVTPYNLEDFRGIVKALSLDAKEADAESLQAIEASKAQTGQKIIDMLQKGIENKTQVINSIIGVMTSIFQYGGQDSKQAKETAKEQVKSWIEEKGGKSISDLFAYFQQDERVQELMRKSANGVAPIESEIPQQDEKEAIDKFNRDLSTAYEKGQNLEQLKQYLLPKAGEKYGAYALGMIGPNIEGVARDRVLSAVQREINKLYKTPAVPQAATAAKSIQTNPAAAPVAAAPVNSIEQRRQQLEDLRTQAADPNNPNRHKAMLALAHHKDYMHLGKLTRVHQWMKDNHHHFSPEEHAAAMGVLNNKISSLEGKGSI